jgi:hypothetical protein
MESTEAVRKGVFGVLCLIAACLLPRSAAAGFEVSLGFSFNKSNYADLGYTWSRRWGATFGYHFSDTSEIEVGFQDITDRAKIVDFQDTTFHDQIYSLNWVQSLVGRSWAVQPYFKIGVGQLNREASGEYASGGSPPLRVDSVTGILGGGLRIYLTRAFAIRTEVTSYLTGGSIRTWRDNLGVTIGTSIQF